MKFLNLKTVHLVILAATLTPISTALADGAAGASTGSDYRAEELSLTLDGGDIRKRNGKLKFEGSFLMDSKGSKGTSLQLDAGKKLVLGDVDEGGAVGILVEPKVKLRWDNQLESGRPEIETLKTKQIDAEVGGLALLYGQDIDTGTTSDISFIGVSGIYRDKRDMNIKQVGAKGSLAKASLHVAFKVNDLPLDLCAKLEPLAVLMGRSEGRGALEGIYSACAGVKLGPVGHLTHEISYDTDYKAYAKISNRTELKDIAGLPMFVAHTHEKESSRSAAPISRQLISSGVAF